MMYKICPQCGTQLKIGQACRCSLDKRLERQKRYDRDSRDKVLAKFYHSGLWLDTRRAVLARYGWLDMYALKVRGEMVPADTVHHIIPVRDDWDRRFDMSNLLPVSRASHEEIHSIYGTAGAALLKEKLFDIILDYREQSVT